MAENADKQLIKRFDELAERADKTGFWTETSFLTLSEQDLLSYLSSSFPFSLFGGYTAAERKLAAFGSEELFGAPYSPPICCIQIAPVVSKFADTLTHRDFLGALMSLGIERNVLGDILIIKNIGYLFCLEKISDFIIHNLDEIKNTRVHCTVTAAPAALNDPPKVTGRVVASERLDAMIASVYQLSRSEGKALIEKEKVFINSRLTTNASVNLVPGSIISVRGKGRFSYEGLERETKKGRLRVLVRIY